MTATILEITERQCRKCRKYFEVSELVHTIESGVKRYYCRDNPDCNWVNTKKAKLNQEIKTLDADIELLETEVNHRIVDFTAKQLQLNPNQGKKYVLTAAQNNTPVHREFLASLRYYCQVHDAELVVIPYLYRNPTSPDESLYDEVWYDSAIAKDLVDQRLYLDVTTKTQRQRADL